MSNIDKCLLILQEDMDIHVAWKEWNIEHAEHINGCAGCLAMQRVAGDEDWHDSWIQKYSLVIDTLKEIRETSSI